MIKIEIQGSAVNDILEKETHQSIECIEAQMKRYDHSCFISNCRIRHIALDSEHILHLFVSVHEN